MNEKNVPTEINQEVERLTEELTKANAKVTKMKNDYILYEHYRNGYTKFKAEAEVLRKVVVALMEYVKLQNEG